MSRAHEATIAVLAGGAGSRMGRAKGELLIAGRPILAHLAERSRGSGPIIVITAPGRERPPGAECVDGEFVDPIAGLGPLRGVLTALENASTPIVIVTTIDMPGIGDEQVDWLIHQLAARPGAPGILISRGEEIEPFPSIYRTSAAQIIREQIAAMRLSIRALLAQPGFELVSAPTQWDERVWTNLNTSTDLARFLGDEKSKPPMGHR